MSEIALAGINSFASQTMQADFVPTSEQLITLTYGQLQDLVIQAVEKAIQPLQDEISDLKVTVTCQDAKIAALETTQEHDVSRLALDIAYDRQRLAKLEMIEPQPLQKDRGEILRALLAANGGKMLAKEARRMMHLSKSRFSELLSRTNSDIEKRPYHLDRTQNIIILR
jgi:uncharacterized membrane protein